MRKTFIFIIICVSTFIAGCSSTPPNKYNKDDIYRPGG